MPQAHNNNHNDKKRTKETIAHMQIILHDMNWYSIKRWNFEKWVLVIFTNGISKTKQKEKQRNFKKNNNNKKGYSSYINYYLQRLDHHKCRGERYRKFHEL